MCGRYTLIRLADFTDMFPWIRAAPPSEWDRPRFNVAPTQRVAVVPNDGRNQVDFFQWGLVPHWAKDASCGSRMINARREGVADKPAFRSAFRRRRCLVPASGFYEWKKHPDGKTKTPMHIRMKDKKPFAFAGLWEVWRAPDGSKLQTCTIITGPPNELVGAIHDRMPSILKPEDYHRWLDPDELPTEELTEMLQPYPAELMEAYAVSRAVNAPKNDSPELIAPVTDDANRSEGSAGRPARRRGDRPDPTGDAPTLF
jgi:putative SOS response-associated peptidase YedK